MKIKENFKKVLLGVDKMKNEIIMKM